MRGAAVGVLVSFLLLAGPSAAQAEEWTADPPGVWRNMTWDDATTTSKCIGALVSPICAVETMRACFVRNQNALCQRAVVPFEGDEKVGLGIENRNSWEKYRLSRVKKVATNQRIDVAKIKAVAGDYLVDVDDISCLRDQCGEEGGPPTTYLVRKTEKGWRVISWDTPRW